MRTRRILKIIYWISWGLFAALILFCIGHGLVNGVPFNKLVLPYGEVVDNGIDWALYLFPSFFTYSLPGIFLAFPKKWRGRLLLILLILCGAIAAVALVVALCHLVPYLRGVSAGKEWDALREGYQLFNRWIFYALRWGFRCDLLALLLGMDRRRWFPAEGAEKKRMRRWSILKVLAMFAFWIVLREAVGIYCNYLQNLPRGDVYFAPWGMPRMMAGEDGWTMEMVKKFVLEFGVCSIVFGALSGWISLRQHFLVRAQNEPAPDEENNRIIRERFPD